MAAYLIGHIEVTDPAGLLAYEGKVDEVVAMFGGNVITRAGSPPSLEANTALVVEGTMLSASQRHVLVEFPDFETAKAFLASDAYAPLRTLRDDGSVGEGIIIDAP